MAATIASAVAIVPDDSEPHSNHIGLKRRQSDTAEPEASKRQRTSSGKNSPENPLANETESDLPKDSPSETVKPAPKIEKSNEPRRRSAVHDDKQRSKRLFGALLGNLNASQPSDRAAKRRADIEARRKAELAKQDNERLEDKQRRLRELTQHRKRKQIYMDEQDLHTRHSNLLDIANMLQTKAEPKLYYRPWDLLPDEEDQIEDQLAEARTRVDDEVAAFEVEKKKRLAALDGAAVEETSQNEEAPTVTETISGDSGSIAQVDSADSEHAVESFDSEKLSKIGEASVEAVAASEMQKAASDEKNADAMMTDAKKEEAVTNAQTEKEAEADDDGEQVVEGDEDNVIY